MTLDALAKASGVSKSMLSQIERNEANPTVAVLWRLTSALGVALADFLTVERAELSQPVVALLPSYSTPEIRSPDGKCILRILGPTEMVGKIEWYELRVDPGGVLASEPHSVNTKEHLSLLSGQLTLNVAGTQKLIQEGETARYPADVRHVIVNEQEKSACALLVVECA
ncbi:XRE family transcriptional regulator [Pendulispora albinea]|uniref:XRE family transcriptional regulator n=1 Tax=Pendulispora albinea TaxID=2741071 RepID=A0ABZ2M9Z3_9BACT